MLALSEPPDIIITDMCMPEVDGIAFTKWARSQESLAGIPLLLITALNDQKLLTLGLAAGADDFLTKPINSLEIRTRIQTLLRSRAAISKLNEKTRTPRCEDDTLAIRRMPNLKKQQQTTVNTPQILLIDDDPCEIRRKGTRSSLT